MEIKEPKFKPGEKVVDSINDEQLIVSQVAYYRFYDDNYVYILKRNGGENFGYEEESHLTPYIEKPKSVWDLKDGDTYYSIYGNGNVSSEKKWFDDEYENNYREIGNVFLTNEEAKFDIERRMIETEMLKLGGRRKFELGKANWYLEYRPMSEGIEAMWTTYEMRQGTIYYDSEEKAKNVVEIIGKDIIKKYIFGVDA